jgi:hypothetical protein
MAALALIVLLALSILAAAFAADAQQPPAKVFRIGQLTLASPSTDDPEGFRQGLHELGYIEEAGTSSLSTGRRRGASIVLGHWRPTWFDAIWMSLWPQAAPRSIPPRVLFQADEVIR